MEFRRCKEMIIDAGFEPNWISSLNEETTIHAFYNDFFYLQVYSDRRETVVQGIDLHSSIFRVIGDRRLPRSVLPTRISRAIFCSRDYTRILPVSLGLYATTLAIPNVST